ncbi:MAG: hypothetical protein U0325_03640 [Polyangiales bacterium]
MNRLVPAAFFAAVTLITPALRAQVRWALDRFDTTPAGDPFVAVDHPRYGGSVETTVAAALRLAYAYEPLVARSPGQAPRAVVTHSAVSHLGVALRALGRVEFDLAVPVSLVEQGRSDGNGPRAFNAASVGDPRVGARLRLLGALDGPASLHLGVQLYLGFLGITPASANQSDGWARGRFTLIGAGHVGNVRWSLSTSVHARPTTRVGADVVASSELQMGAAVAYGFAGGRVLVGPELWLRTALDAPFGDARTSLEASVGARVELGSGLALQLAAGPGLVSAPGTPNLRAVAGLTWEPGSARGR